MARIHRSPRPTAHESARRSPRRKQRPPARSSSWWRGRATTTAFIPLLWATLVALVVPLPLLFVDPATGSAHDAGRVCADPACRRSICARQLASSSSRLVLSLLASAAVVPGASSARARTRSRVEQFLAHGLHTTEARTGVLIFVSLAERYAEIVADAGIAAKVDQAVWDASIAALLADIRDGRLADGLVGGDRAGRRGACRAFPAAPARPQRTRPTSSSFSRRELMLVAPAAQVGREALEVAPSLLCRALGAKSPDRQCRAGVSLSVRHSGKKPGNGGRSDEPTCSRGSASRTSPDYPATARSPAFARLAAPASCPVGANAPAGWRCA